MFACASEEADVPEVLVDLEAPDEVFKDFTTEETDSGLTKWTLSAPTAHRYMDRRVVILERPTIQFFDDFGELQTTLDADSGSYTEDTRDMLAYGNVVVSTSDGKTLETDSLYWNNETEKIETESFVRITEGPDVITGYGLECYPNLNAVDIKRDVTATVSTEAVERKAEDG